MMMACSIVIDRLENGTYRATCPVFPDLEAVAGTEEAARTAFEKAIEAYVHAQLADPLARRASEGNLP